MAIGLVIAAAAGIAFSAPLWRERCEAISGRSTVEVGADRLARGQAKTFCYKDAAGQVRFVLARGADGKIHSVLDACRQCYTFHKGYELSGGYLICRLCGNRYPINKMAAGKASCVPVKLDHQEEDGRIKIKVADLNEAHKLF